MGSYTEIVTGAIKEFQRKRRPCVLCGKKSRHCGVFVAKAEAAQDFGAAAGKDRSILYSLCSRHGFSVSVCLLVEDKLRALLGLEAHN
jgi:hypothetical protein